MNNSNFNLMIKHMANYLQRAKHIPDDTIRLWFNRVNHIPDEATAFIRDYICDTCDGFPRNPPKVIKEAYMEYKKSNNYQTTYEETKCQECFGFGSLTGLKYQIEKGMRLPYLTLYRCTSCHNWERSFGVKVPSANYRQMLSYGYEVIDNRKPPITSKTEEGKIKYKHQILEMF